ncbi:hypothetical protein QC334_00605 [Streptomyces sp. DH18]|uniref:hypothetical protein n=1 Tax=Streptomyces sp. DH18 TaxID=3040126 RepID=UPI00244348E9|nr:hypothetical protein [Streptomyces sp. DH18]MDG9681248.1 hypothetical protein [Streptomyces sp. DH18]
MRATPFIRRVPPEELGDLVDSVGQETGVGEAAGLALFDLPRPVLDSASRPQ